MKLYTIGHSTHPIDVFIGLLSAHHITHVVDVRTIPKSRHVPWFNSPSLARALAKEKIHYTHMKELGGLRHAQKESINMGWHNASFRGYADYMQTPEFAEALQKLKQLLSATGNVVIMCAEAVPWRCHRSLIADALLIQDVEVFHIMNASTASPHKLTAFAKIDKSFHPPKVFYPTDQEAI